MSPYIGMMVVAKLDLEIRIEGIGYDWIVGRDEIGEPKFFSFNSHKEMLVWIERGAKNGSI